MIGVDSERIVAAIFPEKSLANDMLKSGTACGLVAARRFRERPRIGCDGFGDGPAIHELPLASAGD